MKVLLITSEWPTLEKPAMVPFIVREVEALRESGVDLEIFSFRGAMRVDNYARAWMKLRQRLSRYHYDLLHAQFGQSGLLAIFPKDHPLVVTYQGSDLNGIVGTNNRITLPGFILRKVSQLVALRADKIILVSKKLAYFLPSGREYHVVPGGIDLHLFRPIPQAQAREALGLDPKRRYVLFAGGRNNPIKRYTLAREAVACLDTGLNSELLVANDVLPEQIPLYMNAADVLVLTSTREGSPNVVKEALACDLPVVSVDVGDVRERVGGVKGCIICDDDQPETIAQALEQALRRRRRVDGRAAVGNLDITLTAQQIIQVYRQAIKGVTL